jgi:hypothetical protein
MGTASEVGVLTFIIDQACHACLEVTMVDIAMILKHLRQAEHHIALSERHVHEQRQRVAQMSDADRQRSRKLLATFEESLRVHLQGRETILRELDLLK